MAQQNFYMRFPMSLTTKLIQLRKLKGLTQQAMADTVGIHVNSIKKYEADQAQPSIEVLKKIATAFHVSTDSLLFDSHERGPEDDLKLQFEAISSFESEEKKVIKALLEGMILKHETKRIAQFSN
jgi:transcriptional regulator with XRE-family HTH domain